MKKELLKIAILIFFSAGSLCCQSNKLSKNDSIRVMQELREYVSLIDCYPDSMLFKIVKLKLSFKINDNLMLSYYFRQGAGLAALKAKKNELSGDFFYTALWYIFRLNKELIYKSTRNHFVPYYLVNDIEFLKVYSFLVLEKSIEEGMKNQEICLICLYIENWMKEIDYDKEISQKLNEIKNKNNCTVTFDPIPMDSLLLDSELFIIPK